MKLYKSTKKCVRLSNYLSIHNYIFYVDKFKRRDLQGDLLDRAEKRVRLSRTFAGSRRETIALFKK